MSIKRRITIGFGVLVAGLLLFFSIFIYQNYESYRKNLIRSRLQRRALGGQLYFQDRMEFHRSSYLTLTDQHEIILNSKNQVLYNSSGPDDYKLTAKLLADAREQEVYFEYHAKPWSAAKEGVALAFKVQGVTYVSVVTAYDLTGRQANENLLFILITGNVILLVIVAFASFWFARRALRPFDGLIRQMDPAAVNDFSFRLKNESQGDEAAYLATSFNELLGRLQTLAISQEHFVSYASHEIRTPLTVVKGVLETSLAYDKHLSDTRQSISKALVRLEGAIELANSLLHLAEVEGLQAEKFQQDINIVDTILDTITYFGEKHPDQHIELRLTDTFTEYSSSVKILGNATLLRTVLNNILENASKYSDSKPIDLLVDLENRQLSVKVTDQGIGIPGSEINDIFLPMMRAANVGNLPGFGLGLTIAKKIIDMHRGTFIVESKKDQGTMVCILLPALPFS